VKYINDHGEEIIEEKIEEEKQLDDGQSYVSDEDNANKQLNTDDFNKHKDDLAKQRKSKIDKIMYDLFYRKDNLSHKEQLEDFALGFAKK
jgi:hypothetical protein